MMLQAAWFRLLASIVALSLTGCAMLGGVVGKGTVFGGRQDISFRIDEDLNGNTPVAVELIVLYDKDLDDELSALTAQQWFAKRQQILRDFSREELVTFRWEWTPGQVPLAQRFRYRSGALALLFFASYSSPGEHRARLPSPNHPIRVQLDGREFHVESTR